jgi:uncharacterized integral membrane protein (TIGR00698 family)
MYKDNILRLIRRFNANLHKINSYKPKTTNQRGCGILKFNFDLIKGVLICFLIAVPSWILGKMIPIIGGPVIGMLFGMTIVAFRRESLPSVGIRFTSKNLLQASIVLLGFGMNLSTVISVGGQSLYVMLFTLTASFVTAYFVGKMLKLPGKTTVLIGVGTSICGGSAIAATAPVIGADEDEIAHAISTIFLFNILAVVLFPFLGRLFSMSDTAFGIWAGTAINDTSSVVAAATSWSEARGSSDALELATIVKLTRTLMIVPITLFLAFYQTQIGIRSASSKRVNFVSIFPWFVVGFLAAAVIGTVGLVPALITSSLASFGKFMIVMAMSAIGLTTSFDKLLKNGLRPIGLGLSCWAVVAFVSIAVQKLSGLW